MHQLVKLKLSKKNKFTFSIKSCKLELIWLNLSMIPFVKLSQVNNKISARIYERVLAPSVGLFLLGKSGLATYNILNFPPTQMKI